MSFYLLSLHPILPPFPYPTLFRSHARHWLSVESTGLCCWGESAALTTRCSDGDLWAIFLDRCFQCVARLGGDPAGTRVAPCRAGHPVVRGRGAGDGGALWRSVGPTPAGATPRAASANQLFPTAQLSRRLDGTSLRGVGRARTAQRGC